MGLFDILGSVAKGIGDEIKSYKEEYQKLLEKYEDESDDRLFSKIKNGYSMAEKTAAYKTLVDRHGKEGVRSVLRTEAECKAMIRKLDEQMRRM